jgi:MFS family permease
MDICSLFTFLYVSSVFKTMAIQLGNGALDDHWLTLTGAIGGLANGGSRIFWGYLQDIFGFKKIYAFILVTQVLVSLTLTSVVTNKVLYMVWILIGYNCLGAHFVLFPTVLLKVFGLKSGG